ncbi:MAG: ABC transporter ATP-binding protein [Bifidobacteriaceae bacterium]|jgi:peptide/nickel transport system ATP-binding protein|nr:ABC transporter ATP-binding protein [Bifidobacteriaceae bacterium]
MSKIIPEASETLLDVQNLSIDFDVDKRKVHAVQGVSFTVEAGQKVAIVGESGSGKSTTAHSLINLLPGSGHVTGGSIKLEGREMVGESEKTFVQIRGKKIGLVPQDPMSNLNPVYKIGKQIGEALDANNVDVDHDIVQKVVDGKLEIQHSDDELFLGRNARRKIENEVLKIWLAEAKYNVDEIMQKVPKESQDNLSLRKDLFNILVAAGVSEENASDIHSRIVKLHKSMTVGSSIRIDVIHTLQKFGISESKATQIAHEHIKGSEKVDRIAGLLAEAGLVHAGQRAKQYPHEFSGGMRQRALIAMGLAARPRLLIADEPTSALDVTVQKRILDRINRLTSTLGVAVLFITHDLGLAAEYSDKLIVMHKGRIVESGASLEVLRNPKHPYTKKLMNAAPSLNATRMISESTSQIDKSIQKSFNVFEFENLTKEFKLPGTKKNFKAVDDITFAVQRGKTTAIVGESGSGKSTVANMALGLLKPTSGRILFESTNMDEIMKSKKLSKDFRMKVQPVFQNPYGSLDPLYSLGRAIAEPMEIHGVGNSKSRTARVKELLELVQLPSSIMTRYPNELSGGQRQRIAIARALALNSELILLDEAVSALDVLVQEQILHLLNNLQKELGLTYLFITHDLAVVNIVADEVVVMESGKLVETGKTADIFKNPKQEYTKNLLEAIPGRNLI